VLPPLLYLHLKRNQMSLKPQIMRTTKTSQNIQRKEVAKGDHRSGSVVEVAAIAGSSLVRR
jgi:hypothetical protein